eukprot:tig00000123_g6921.t2
MGGQHSTGRAGTYVRDPHIAAAGSFKPPLGAEAIILEEELELDAKKQAADLDGRQRDWHACVQVTDTAEESGRGDSLQNALAAASSGELGWLHLVRGDCESALPLLERALSLATIAESMGPTHKFTGEMLFGIARARHALGERPAALLMYERALEIKRANSRRRHGDDPEVATVLLWLGKLHTEAGRLDKAKPLLERSLSIRVKPWAGHGGPGHTQVAECLTATAALLQATGRRMEAERMLEEAFGLLQRAERSGCLGAGGADPGPEVPETLHALAAIIAERRPHAAAALFEVGVPLPQKFKFSKHLIRQRALGLRRRLLVAEHADTRRTEAALAAARARCER